METKLNKILLFTPFSQNKDYIILDFINQLEDLYNYYKSDFTINLQILLIDNSTDPNYHKKFINNFSTIKHINPNNREIKYYLAESQEIARTYAIKNNFDYIFSLECDIFVQLDILHQFLIAIAEKPEIKVISAPYFIGLGIGSFILSEAIDTTVSINQHYIRSYVQPLVNSFIFTNASVKQVYGAGIGCMLISNEVFKKIKFHVSEIQNGPSDKFFNKDCHNNKIKIFSHTGLQIKHYNSDWSSFVDYKE